MTARFKVQPRSVLRLKTQSRSVLRLRRMGSGPAGASAWQAVPAIVADGERRVQRIVDWVGGSGTKPATGQYIGPAGLVDLAAAATDIRGGAGGTASLIVLTPVGNVAATNVQAAIAELDSEKADAAAMANALSGKVDTSTFAESVDDRVAALLVAGSGVSLTYDDAGNALTISTTLAVGHCRLSYVSATSVRLDPLCGNRVMVNGTLRAIPAAGVAAANTAALVNGVAGQNLAANTVYLVSLYWTGSALALAFWPLATGHGADTSNGTEIITGHADHALVGQIRTNASSQFQDDVTFRGVASWFNRRPRPIRTVWTGASINVTATSFTTVGNSISFLTWADAAVSLFYDGSWDLPDNGTSAFTFNATLFIDGNTSTATYGYTNYFAAQTGNFFAHVGLSSSVEMAEGFHTAQFGCCCAASASALSVQNPVLHGVVFI